MLGLIPLLAAAAAFHTIDVLGTLGSKVHRAQSRSGVPVLIPSTIRSEFSKLYGDVTAQQGGYVLDLGAARRCHGGGACGVAYFSGDVNGKLLGKRKVKLAKGFSGRFVPTRCGASCSSPLVDWKAEGATYTVAVKGLPGKSERKALVKVANSAINRGAR